jgi:hypothetical protein
MSARNISLHVVKKTPPLKQIQSLSGFIVRLDIYLPCLYSQFIKKRVYVPDYLEKLLNMIISTRKGDPMKKQVKLRRGLAIFVVAASFCLIVILSIGTIASAANPQGQSQGEIRRASPTPPPDVVAMEKMLKDQEKIPKAQARATKQQLEDIIAKQDNGSARIKLAKGKSAPKLMRTPNTTAPPEVVEQGNLEKQLQQLPKVQSRATRQHLEDIITKQAGGADKLNKAKQRIAPTSQNGQDWGNAMNWLTGFGVRDAHAQTTLSRDYRVSRPAVMLGNNPNYFDLSSPNPSGDVVIFGQYLYFRTPSITYAGVGPSVSYFVADGKQNFSYIRLVQSFPASGYYIVNLNAYAYFAGTTVKLWHYGSTGWANLKTFTNSTPSMVNMPHLDYYTAGTHYFNWTVPAGFLYVYQINVDAY